MPYRPLVPSVTLPPQVKRLVWKLERHYLAPAHAMFRLPVANYRLIGEFHFAIGHVLLGAIAGISTTLYAHTGSNGDRFRKLLVDYYPFASEPGNTIPNLEAARMLWSVFRNPLAHDLGFDLKKKAKTPAIKVVRRLTRIGSHNTRGLTERMIEALEETSERPIMKPTLTVRVDATVLFVDALYWGTRRMLEDLLVDTTRIQAAEKFLNK
jgi:hypothetical protein